MSKQRRANFKHDCSNSEKKEQITRKGGKICKVLFNTEQLAPLPTGAQASASARVHLAGNSGTGPSFSRQEGSARCCVVNQSPTCHCIAMSRLGWRPVRATRSTACLAGAVLVLAGPPPCRAYWVPAAPKNDQDDDLTAEMPSDFGSGSGLGWRNVPPAQYELMEGSGSEENRSTFALDGRQSCPTLLSDLDGTEWSYQVPISKPHRDPTEAVTAASLRKHRPPAWPR